MDFVVIDFETANAARSSACEIGATRVRNNTIEETKSWLIKPQNNFFDSFNVALHGITPEMVENEPEFPFVLNNVLDFIGEDIVVAHNAAFDMSVLRYACDAYEIKYPSLRYICSYLFSRKVWPELPSYDLKSICRHLEIPEPSHRGGSDSLSTAHLVLSAINKVELAREDQIRELLHVSIGKLYDNGYTKCSSYFRSYRGKLQSKAVPIPGDPEKFDEANIFFQKNVCFTGALSSMKRIDAQQIVVNIGGNAVSSVNKETDFLIVGQQDFRRVGDDGMSEKQEKAIKMVEKGHQIEIMSESDFLKNID